MDNANNCGRYLNIREASSFLGIASGTLYQWVCKAPGLADPIPFVKFSARCLRFPFNDLVAWSERRRSGPMHPTTTNKRFRVPA